MKSLFVKQLDAECNVKKAQCEVSLCEATQCYEANQCGIAIMNIHSSSDAGTVVK